MRPIRITAALVAAVALAAGCSGTDEPTQAATSAAPAAPATATSAAPTSTTIPGFPHTLEGPGGTWTLETPPQRIVSLSPSSTEILFAIGAGNQVIAVDDYSTYPPTAPTTDLSGWDPNAEALLSFEPDLVVIANDANEIIAALTAAAVPVFVDAAPVDIESGYAGIAQLGAVTGRTDESAELIEMMRAGMAAAFAAGPSTPVRLYHELDDTHYSISSASFIGAVYAEFGVENIADAADGDGWGYPQLTPEYIVDADPEVIVITDLLGYSAADVAARPGWGNITAVRNGDIVTVNADVASRWGPRLPQFAATIAEAVRNAAG